MSARVSIAAAALGLALASPVFASDVGYLYGSVVTVDGDEYVGQLRWGAEESFWDDLFNADKKENERLQDVDRKVLRRKSLENSGGLDMLFGKHLDSFDHLFAVRFGDLKSIRVLRGDDLVVTFRNGEELQLEGGSNDVGARITVVDPREGQRAINWNRIRTIEFRDTPQKLDDKLGDPIYGTVKSGRYEFTGRIQWDNDECLSVDELDGDTKDGKVSIPFSNIRAIRKHQRGSMVTLESGRQLYVTGTNDVNRENRGIVVVVKGVGSIKIGWDDFEDATFRDAPNSGRSYADYAEENDIIGTVHTRDGSYDGRIVYDLDESWDFELLHGMNDATEYLIPFRDIARIKPQGTRGADVELHNGLTVELEDSQDVSRRNDGLLVFAGRGKPQYIEWRNVTEVVLK